MIDAKKSKEITENYHKKIRKYTMSEIEKDIIASSTNGSNYILTHFCLTNAEFELMKNLGYRLEREGGGYEWRISW